MISERKTDCHFRTKLLVLINIWKLLTVSDRLWICDVIVLSANEQMQESLFSVFLHIPSQGIWWIYIEQNSSPICQPLVLQDVEGQSGQNPCLRAVTVYIVRCECHLKELVHLNYPLKNCIHLNMFKQATRQWLIFYLVSHKISQRPKLYLELIWN